MLQTHEASISNVRRLPSFGGHWPMLSLQTEILGCWIFCLLFPDFPSNFLHLEFCPTKLTSMDLLALTSLLFCLGSAKGRQIVRQQDVREVTWLPSPFPSLRLDCSLAGAAFPYYLPQCLANGSPPTASHCIPVTPSDPKDSMQLLVSSTVFC